MSSLLEDRRFRARTLLTIKLPVVCPDAFRRLLDETSEVEGASDAEERDAILEELPGHISRWTCRHRLDADWLRSRLGSALAAIHVIGDFEPVGRDPVPELHPYVWDMAGRWDSDLDPLKSIRRRPPYSGALDEYTNEFDQPSRFHGPECTLPGTGVFDAVEDEADTRRNLRPVVAWPEQESRAEFQTRALRHFDARVTLAKSLGLSVYRKTALERHIVWLLQQRVLGLRLNDIADREQEERDRRRSRDSTVIDSRSVSREIKRLEKLLPL